VSSFAVPCWSSDRAGRARLFCQLPGAGVKPCAPDSIGTVLPHEVQPGPHAAGVPAGGGKTGATGMAAEISGLLYVTAGITGAAGDLNKLPQRQSQPPSHREVEATRGAFAVPSNLVKQLRSSELGDKVLPRNSKGQAPEQGHSPAGRVE